MLRGKYFQALRVNSGKATLIELLWVWLLMGGATFGFMFGRSHFGMGGGLLGIPLDLGVGLLVCSGIASLLNRWKKARRRQ